MRFPTSPPIPKLLTNSKSEHAIITHNIISKRNSSTFLTSAAVGLLRLRFVLEVLLFVAMKQPPTCILKICIYTHKNTTILYHILFLLSSLLRIFNKLFQFLKSIGNSSYFINQSHIHCFFSNKNCAYVFC